MDNKNIKSNNRKIIRLTEYSYSENGAYFITICTKDKHNILGTIKGEEYRPTLSVGDGIPDVPKNGRRYEVIGYKSAEVNLSETGNIVKETIEYINQHNENVLIDKYVIMPNHLHMIIIVDRLNGTSRMPSPTKNYINNRTNELIPKLVSSLKRFTNKKSGYQLWQRSYNDHIIRNQTDYERIWNYIDINPLKWELDEYYI